MSNVLNPALAAAGLVDSGAFRFNLQQPFKVTSGLLSPFYIHCASLYGHTQIREMIGDQLAELIKATPELAQAEVIAGAVTVGVPLAAMVAARLQKPLVFIRPEPKAHGTGQQIEGCDVAGKKVVLIDDLITHGSSKLKFLTALQKANAQLLGCTVILSRASGKTLNDLADQGMPMHYLCQLPDVLNVLNQRGQLSAEQQQEIEGYVKDPEGWNQKFAA